MIQLLTQINGLERYKNELRRALKVIGYRKSLILHGPPAMNQIFEQHLSYRNVGSMKSFQTKISTSLNNVRTHRPGKQNFNVIVEILILLVIFVVIYSDDAKSNSVPGTIYENTTRSGPVYSSEQWRGTIDITGDVHIYAPASVTIERGTTVRFAAGADDQKDGGNSPITDPNFPNDPAIAPSQISSIDLFGGTLYAVGTLDSPIVFTSSASNPDRGDWQAIGYHIEGSKLYLQHVIIEYGYYGVQINTTADDSDITIRDNTIRHIVACGICGGIDPTLLVTLTVSGNDISDCGHEAIDTHSNATLLIENNIFHDNL